MTPSSTVFTPKTNHTCHQKPNSSRETVPLHKLANLVCDLRGSPAPVQCPAAVTLLLIPTSSSEVVDKKVHRHPTHLTLQHTGKKFNQRVGHSTDSTVFIHASESRSDRKIFKNIYFNISLNTKDLTVTQPTHLTLQHTGKKFNLT
jgi:hypothetical protein